MEITQHSEVAIAFLLVDETAKNGVAGAAPAVSVSMAGQPFVLLNDVEITETGGGWYMFVLPADYTATIGPLIIVASAEQSPHEWRDIHYVTASQLDAGLTREEIMEIVAEEMAAWSARLLVPIEFIRIGAAG